MDIQAQIGNIFSPTFSSRKLKAYSSTSSCSSFYPYSYYWNPKFFCSRRDSQENPQNDQNGDDKYSTDWDKAWSNFSKQGKKTLFSKFSPNKYVSWNPKRSDYPLSEEVDPIKRAEKSNLMLWNSPTFTLVGAILLVLFLLIYTILAPVK